LREREGCYVWLGTRVHPDTETIPLHSNQYDFEDRAIPIGAAYWVNLVKEELS